jgi:hypothetical protein
MIKKSEGGKERKQENESLKQNLPVLSFYPFALCSLPINSIGDNNISVYEFDVDFVGE